MRRYTMDSKIQRPVVYASRVLKTSVSCLPLPTFHRKKHSTPSRHHLVHHNVKGSIASSRSSEFESASTSGNNNNNNNTNNNGNTAYRGRCHTMSDISDLSPNKYAIIRPNTCDFLNCSLCNQKYQKPKILPCMHTFCESCLLSDIPAHSIAATCPLCDQPSILPPGGVTALQNNEFVASLTDDMSTCEHSMISKMTVSCRQCVISMCELCARLHDPDHDVCVPMSPDENTPSRSPRSENSRSSTILVCRGHNDTPLCYYCRDCETAVCVNCTESSHRDHDCVGLNEVVEEKRKSLENLLESSKQKIPNMQNTVEKLEKICGSLDDNYQRARLSADQTFHSLESLLRQRHHAISDLLETAFHSKRCSVQQQIADITVLMRNMNNCDTCTNVTLDNGTDTDILVLGKEVTEKFNNIKKKSSIHPNMNHQFSFDSDSINIIKKQLSILGSVGLDEGLPVYTVVSGAAIKRCYCQRKCHIRVTVRDENSCDVKLRDIADLHVKITKELVDDVSHVEDVTIATSIHIERVNEACFEVTYIIANPGVCYIHIYLYGDPIKDSPFKIDVYEDSYVRLRSRSTSRIPTKTMVLLSPQTAPSVMSTSSSGKRRALKRPSSCTSQRIRTFGFFTTDDDLLARIGEKGRSRGQFTNPQGVACFSNDSEFKNDITLYITDSNNQCVQAFSMETGELKMRFGIRGRLPGQLLRPTGITVTQRNNVLVADYDNQCVNVYSAIDGKFKSKICSGKLLGPKGICVDSKGRVIVVDNRSSCVVVFSPTGKFINKFGCRGSGDPESYLAGPHFCSTTSQDDIVVSDFHNHCIKVYDSDGVFKFSFGKNGELAGEFNAPTGVAVDKHGNILVADWGNSRIQVFNSEGEFLSFISTSSDALYGPQGISVTSSGVVAVADSGNHCMKLYRYLS